MIEAGVFFEALQQALGKVRPPEICDTGLRFDSALLFAHKFAGRFVELGKYNNA